jgi:hypothetical protein
MNRQRDDELELVYRPKDELQGKILEGVMKGEEIPCYLRSRQIPWMDDIMEFAEGYWGELFVPKEYVDRAKTIITTYLEESEKEQP